MCIRDRYYRRSSENIWPPGRKGRARPITDSRAYGSSKRTVPPCPTSVSYTHLLTDDRPYYLGIFTWDGPALDGQPQQNRLIGQLSRMIYDAMKGEK